MRSSTIIQLLLSSIVVAAPAPQVATSAPPTTPASPPNVIPASAAPPSAPVPAPAAGAAPAGGFDFGALTAGLGGLDLGALLGGLAAPDVAADTIISGYKAVAEKNNAVVKAAEAIPATGDATAAVKDLLAKVKDVGTALKDATTKIGGIQNVGYAGSMGLSAPGSEVTGALRKASEALVAKKDIIIKAGQKDQFLQAAKDWKAGVDAWTKAINAKLPELSLESANAETATSLSSTDKIIAAFT